METRNKDSPVVYICSRYRGDIAHNMAMARRYSRFAADRGCVPLERCDELWVCGDEISEGMAREIARAEQVGIPTRYITEEDIYVRD